MKKSRPAWISMFMTCFPAVHMCTNAANAANLADLESAVERFVPFRVILPFRCVQVSDILPRSVALSVRRIAAFRPATCPIPPGRCQVPSRGYGRRAPPTTVNITR